MVDVEACIKLLATFYFFKHEAWFRRAKKCPGGLLREVKFSVKEYVEVIRVVTIKLSKRKKTSMPPSYKSLGLQSKRGNSVFGYWQDGLQEEMPDRPYAGHGWGIHPAAKGSDAERMTKENCIMWLSEHSYIDTDGKTVTLACGCNPQAALKHKCKGCGCRQRKCSLACGCRGRCHLGGAPAPSAPAGPSTSSVVANAMALFAAQARSSTSQDEHPEEEESSDGESVFGGASDSGESSESDSGSDCDDERGSVEGDDEGDEALSDSDDPLLAEG